MVKSGKKGVKSCIFAPTGHSNVLVHIALYPTITNNNTPSMPLRNAHLGGFFF